MTQVQRHTNINQHEHQGIDGLIHTLPRPYDVLKPISSHRHVNNRASQVPLPRKAFQKVFICCGMLARVGIAAFTCMLTDFVGQYLRMLSWRTAGD
jgi:hypothetical protein